MWTLEHHLVMSRKELRNGILAHQNSDECKGLGSDSRHGLCLRDPYRCAVMTLQSDE